MATEQESEIAKLALTHIGRCILSPQKSSSPANQPKLIDLVWSEPTRPDDSCPYDHVTAETPIGVFSIEWKGWKDHDGRCVFFAGDYVAASDTLDEAKKIAAEHFAKKVQSCLR